MPQINLTPQETIVLCGFITGVLEIVTEKPDLELDDKENTTMLLTNVLAKLETLNNNN